MRNPTLGRRAAHAMLVALALLVTSCAGEGDPPLGTPAPEPTGGVTPMPLPGTPFADVQRDIFDASCVSGACHSSATRAGGLSLAAAESYDALVEIVPDNSAAADRGDARVVPFDLDASYLLRKLTGELDDGEGLQMPLGAPPLAEDLIDRLRGWIDAGAPRDP